MDQCPCCHETIDIAEWLPVEPYFTVQEVSEELGITVHGVRKLMLRHNIPKFYLRRRFGWPLVMIPGSWLLYLSGRSGHHRALWKLVARVCGPDALPPIPE